MIKLQKYIIVLVFLLGSLGVYAQQLPTSTQYLFNPYALTPTLAGYTGYSEVFLNYRNNWTGINGSPRTFSANGFGNIYQDKMWLGAEIMTDKTDILSVFRANLSYTYKLKVENDQYLFFGVWTTFYQASVNTGGAIGVDPNDPLLQNGSKLNSSAFNAGFGINYNWKNLNIGFSIPSLFGLNADYAANVAFNYQVQRQYQFHVSYLHEFNDSWQLQATSVFQKTGTEPIDVELALMVIYLKRFWLGTLYRNGGALALNIGGHIYGGFVFNYSYEIGLSGINNGSGGAHEITIGYRFNFFGNNYFQKKEDDCSVSRKKRKTTRNISYPEVQDYNLRKN